MKKFYAPHYSADGIHVAETLNKKVDKVTHSECQPLSAVTLVLAHQCILEYFPSLFSLVYVDLFKNFLMQKASILSFLKFHHIAGLTCC